MIPNVDMSDYDQQGCLHDMFVRQARETPNNIAVVSPDGYQMTFAELNSVTDALAIHLRGQGVGRNKVVGIFMERCVEYTISYIAVLKSGGAYLPIEMSYPASLINSVLEDAQPAAICTKTAHAHRLNSAIPIVNVGTSFLEELKKEQQTAISVPVENSSLDDMAYTVYSSGTTGKPKGIQCPHRGAVFSYTWRHRAFPYEKDDREACNIFFVWEMLRPLLKGIPMYIIPDTVIYDPAGVLEFLRKNCITRMLFTPSLLQIILDTQKPAMLTESFKCMRQIWLCGEVVTTALRNKIALAFPWVRILNLYSISECHDVSCSDLTNSFGLEGRTYCPVGKIFPQVRVLIMDENFNEKPIGDAGEIYIGGPTLAIGYLNRSLLNEQRFINTPAHLANTNGERLYKTGDWGYLLSDGSLEVIGRCDSMVKLRGYTVELKAIESALLNIPEVNMACTVVVGSEGSDKMLVAYVVLKESCTRNVGYLHAKLKTQLPFYMIPSRFIFLNRIPIVNSSGKANKSELPEVRSFNEDDIDICDESMDETAKSIARIWCKVLKQCTLSAFDNFFDLGGHSLLAALVMGQINETFGSTLSSSDLFANPTVQSLSKKVRTGENSHTNAVNLHEELQKFAIPQIPNMKLRTFWKTVNFSKTRFERSHVLLTGATGFLGSCVLRNLLQTTQAILYCLVRSSPTKNAKERILHILKARNLSTELLNTRLVLLTGDLSLKKFGLEETEYAALSYSIDVVIHCAAQVNLVLPYAALSQNVTGTHNVVSFCLEDKLKPLHYISTNDVFGMGMKNCSESANMFNHVEKLEYGYAQSKWLAEQIVISASQNGLPTIISRCGNISGCRDTAAWNCNDMTLLILQSVVLSETAPDIPWQIEITPVDFISDVIVKLTKDITKEFGKVYHLINPTTMECRLLWDLLREKGYKIKSASYEEWSAAVSKASVNFQNLQSLLHLLNTRLRTSDYLSNQSTFDQENLNKFLVSHDLQYPQTNRFLMEKYIESLVAGGYLAPPSNESASVSQSTTVFPRLKSKVALVTGASSGIGCAIAIALAKAGIITVGVARQFDKLIELQKRLTNEGIDNFVPLKVDITKKEEVFACVRNIQSTIGAIDILINNAGVMEYCKMLNTELDSWLRMVNVNCIGFLHTVAAVLPHMRKRQSGHIVNITSDAGRKAFSNLAVYSGTKFFEEAVSEALRQEIAAYGIKVSCIQPGDVSSGLHQKSKDQETMMESAYSIEYLKVNEVANAVLFVLNQSCNCAINTVLMEPILGPI